MPRQPAPPAARPRTGLFILSLAWLANVALLIAEEAYQKMPGPVQLDAEVQTLKTHLDFAHAQETDGSSITDLQKKVQANPADLVSRDRLTSLYAARKQYREALDEWLAIVQRDRRFKDEGARKRMLQIFELIDSRSALAREFREKLARAIF